MGDIYDERGRKIGRTYGGGMMWIFGPVVVVLLLWWLVTGEDPFFGNTLEARAKKPRVSISKVSKEKHKRFKDLKTFQVTYHNTDGKMTTVSKKFALLNITQDSLSQLGKLGVNIVSFDSSPKQITELQHAYEEADKTPLVTHQRKESWDDKGHEYFHYYGIEMKGDSLLMPEIIGVKSKRKI